jgi:hypothetical protein
LERGVIEESVDTMNAAACRAELARRTRTTPPAYSSWGYERTVEYKKVAAKATKYLRGGCVDVNLLRPAVRLLRGFW